MKKIILIVGLLLFASNGWAYSETDFAIAPITALQAQEQEDSAVAQEQEDNAVVIIPEEEAAAEEEATQVENDISNFELALSMLGIVLFFYFIYKINKVFITEEEQLIGLVVSLFKSTVKLLIVVVICVAIVAIFAMIFLV